MFDHSLRKGMYLSIVCVNRISGVRVTMLVSGVVDRGFEPRSGQTKDYKICICCFTAKHPALRSNNKDWLSWNLRVMRPSVAMCLSKMQIFILLKEKHKHMYTKTSQRT